MHKLYDYAAAVVVVSSLLYSFLPPVESFAKYPRFQNVYGFVMIWIVRFAAVNFRSKVYPEIQSTANQGGTMLPKGPGQ